MVSLIFNDTLEDEYQLLLKRIQNGESFEWRTENELLFLRVRIGIIEGDIKPEQLIIRCEKLFEEDFETKLDKDGNIPNWPKDKLNMGMKLSQRYLRSLVKRNRETKDA